LGYASIMASGRDLIMAYLNDPKRQTSIDVGEPAGDLNDALRERFSRFTFWGIIAAALVDAINPCAIATMIFLVSFLATQKRKRSEVLAVGLSFSATVFVTYLLLGIGAFAMLTALKGYYIISRVIKWSAVILAGGVGIISLIDAFRFKKSGDTKDITLQLPKSVKLRIHKVITENMKGGRLIIGTIVTGFLVTLLEAVCTGQVYLPTIVLMTRSSSGDMQLTGWLYLIMYNFIFVVPLLTVMIAAYYGMTWNKLAKMTQKNLSLLKVLLGIAMIGLALFLAFA
jgi:cytochrome c biogenesis protein CcdA